VKTEQSPPPSAEKSVTSTEGPKPTAKALSKRRRILILAAIVAGILLLFLGIPRVIRAFNTVSTDDAYVNGYVTFVAPRVSGQVAKVLVDNNNRVKKGDVLAELDPEPYQVQVAIKQAAVDTAQANLTVADANVRGLLGQTRSNRFKLSRAIEDVDNQIADSGPGRDLGTRKGNVSAGSAGV
jgi:membrane fusion protein (multidrug efflux system)